MQIFIIVAVVAVIWALAYHRAPAVLWTLATAAGLILLSLFGGITQVTIILAWLIFAIVALLLNPGPIRRAVVSTPLLGLFRTILPQVSQTEKEALDAGT